MNIQNYAAYETFNNSEIQQKKLENNQEDKNNPDNNQEDKNNPDNNQEDKNNKEKDISLNSILTKFSSLIITAFGVCTALAWNDAFQNFFKNNEYLNKYGPWIYAIIITLIALVSIIYLNKVVKYIQKKTEN